MDIAWMVNLNELTLWVIDMAILPNLLTSIYYSCIASNSMDINYILQVEIDAYLQE